MINFNIFRKIINYSGNIDAKIEYNIIDKNLNIPNNLNIVNIKKEYLHNGFIRKELNNINLRSDINVENDMIDIIMKIDKNKIKYRISHFRLFKNDENWNNNYYIGTMNNYYWKGIEYNFIRT